MTDTGKTVFISYRRSVSSFIARAVFMDLREHDYDVFMDVESIDSGTFDTIILNQIAARAHFLIILTPGTIEYCAEPNDWLRREIEFAMDRERNIVPLLIGGFEFNEQVWQHLTGKLSELPRFNALTVPHDYFEAAMDKLRNRFLKKPVYGKIQVTPAKDRAVVQQKIEEIVNQPEPAKNLMMARQYFYQGYECGEKGDYDKAISNYTEAIRLDPQYAKAYANRGLARNNKGDYDGAIADCTEAIRLDPLFVEAYANRGLARNNKGDYDGAIADYNDAICLNARCVNAYNNRGHAFELKGDYDSALADYEAALWIDPNHKDAHTNRDNLLKKMPEKK